MTTKIYVADDGLQKSSRFKRSQQYAAAVSYMVVSHDNHTCLAYDSQVALCVCSCLEMAYPPGTLTQPGLRGHRRMAQGCCVPEHEDCVSCNKHQSFKGVVLATQN